MDETEEIQKPFFRCTRGEEFEKTCQDIEDEFLTHLKSLKSISHKIFDVQQPTWHDDMFNFRGKMKVLEIRIENLVDTVFIRVDTVEFEIYALYGFKNYMKRESLKSVFNTKTAFVRSFF